MNDLRMFTVTDLPDGPMFQQEPPMIQTRTDTIVPSNSEYVVDTYTQWYSGRPHKVPGNAITREEKVFVPSSPIQVTYAYIRVSGVDNITLRAGFTEPCLVSIYYYNVLNGSDSALFIQEVHSSQLASDFVLSGMTLSLTNTYDLVFKVVPGIQIPVQVGYPTQFTIKYTLTSLLFSVSVTSATVQASFNFVGPGVQVYINTSDTFNGSTLLGTLTTSEITTGYTFNDLTLIDDQTYYVFYVYEYLLDFFGGSNSARTTSTISSVSVGYTNVGLFVSGITNFTGSLRVYLNNVFLSTATTAQLSSGRIFTNTQLIGGQTYTVTFKYIDDSDIDILSGTNILTVPYECKTISSISATSVSVTVTATFNFVSTDVYVYIGDTEIGTRSTGQIFNGATFSDLSLSAGPYSLSFRYPTSSDIITVLSGNLSFTVQNEVVNVSSITSNTQSITVTATTNFTGSLTVTCNGGVGTLGTVTTADLASGKIFTGLSLTGGQIYTLGFGVPVISGSVTTTCPLEVTGIQTITVTNTSFTVRATTNFPGSVTVSYNTTNTAVGALTLGTISKSELAAGYSFTGLTLTGDQTYYLFFNNGITVLSGSNSVTLPQYINNIISIESIITYFTVRATTNFPGSVTVSYNTTNTTVDALTLGTISKSELATGYSFTGLTLSGGQTYYLFFNNGITVLSGSNSVISSAVVTESFVSSAYNSITVSATTIGNVSYTILYNTLNSTSGALSLGNLSQSELSSGRTFTITPQLTPNTLYYIFILFSGYLLNTNSTTSPAPVVSSVTATSTLNSIRVTGTADYSLTYDVFYNTTNSMTGATSLDTATKSELSSGKIFSTPQLTPNTVYYVFIRYLTNTVGTVSTTSPLPVVSSVTATSTFNAIQVTGTADYSLTYDVFYNTINSMTGATSLDTATKSELSSGKAFSTPQLTPSTTYFIFIRYLTNTVGTVNFLSQIYNFSSFTFTNANITGATGPTLSQLRSNVGYTAQSWTQDSTNNYLNMTTQGIQLWRVPLTGTYTIIAAGAGFGDAQRGRGAIVSTVHTLTYGQVIKILVGQTPINISGAGGTFVTTETNQPILVAGGGGGTGNITTTNGGTQDAVLTRDGSNAGGGNGGVNGGSGASMLTGQGANSFATGGAGFTQNSVFNGWFGTYTALSFINGGIGAYRSTSGTDFRGGFGGGGFGSGDSGGGSLAGGGGGYSGGASGFYAAESGGSSGGGGGSYDVNGTTNNTATRYTTPINGRTNGFNIGNGFVRITYLIPYGMLYDFTSFTFTNVGTTGPYGPTSLNGYGTSYPGYNTPYALTLGSGIQQWRVPKTGIYQIIAAGAAATTTQGGRGTIVISTFSLNGGDNISILVGQCGTLSAGPTDACSGGGGGTYVVSEYTNSPLLIAGGGGFQGDGTLVPTLNGGQGGYNVGGGGGYASDGVSDGRQDPNGSGKAFTSGGVGGTQGSSINGGFGGGGAGTRSFGLGNGGAGGYNGGGAGGTSYDSLGGNKSATRYTNPINGQTGGYNTGHGFVRITFQS
jgi:hypothetical protein